MPGEIVAEMADVQSKPPFWRKKGVQFAVLLLLLIFLAAFFSWWLANGRITSVAARLDTMVYTVESRYAARVETVYVSSGEAVETGQVLAAVDVAPSAGQVVMPTGNAGLTGRLAQAQQAERELAARADAARQEEERLRLAYQDRVTEVSRAQILMRSINMRNQAAYQQARHNEAAAQANAEAARAAFEQASLGRAALEKERANIRRELAAAGVAPGADGASASVQPASSTQNELYAPVSGKILSVRARTGEIVRPGQPLFMVLPTGSEYANDSWIQAWFPTSARSKIKPGQKVEVKFSRSENVLTGKVTDVNNSVAAGHATMRTISEAEPDNSPVSIGAPYLPVRISLDDPAEIINVAPGTQAECRVQTRSLF